MRQMLILCWLFKVPALLNTGKHVFWNQNLDKVCWPLAQKYNAGNCSARMSDNQAPPHTHTYCLRWVDSRFINSPIFNHRVSFMYFTDLFVSCFSPQESLGHPLPPFSLNNPVKLVRLLVCGRLTQRAFMTEPRLEPGSLRGLDCHYVHCNGSRVAPLCGWCASAQEGKIFAE